MLRESTPYAPWVGNIPKKQRAGSRARPGSTREGRSRLRGVVHLELDGMRSHAEARELLVLERDIGLQEVLREHPAAREEDVVVLQEVPRRHTSEQLRVAERR